MKNDVVRIPVNGEHIEGALELPEKPIGLVLFAHGSGSSRHSPRNNYVARVLREHGVGTLLMDLLTAEEDRDYSRRFDIDLLVERLSGLLTSVKGAGAVVPTVVGIGGLRSRL